MRLDEFEVGDYFQFWCWQRAWAPARVTGTRHDSYVISYVSPDGMLVKNASIPRFAKGNKPLPDAEAMAARMIHGL